MKDNVNTKGWLAGRRYLLVFSILLVMAMVMSSCQPATDTTTGQTTTTTTDAEASQPATDDTAVTTESDTTEEPTELNESEEPRLRLVTSFLPIYVFTANIIGDLPGISLENMAAPDTGCLHDYRLMPADMIKLEEADLFIINGAGMEGFIADLAAQRSDLPIIEASTGIDLIYLDHEHDHDHEHEDEDEYEGNAHVWLSVPLAIRQVENISQGLQEADPDYAAQYQANSEAYIAKLEALYQEMSEALATVSRREMITFHEAFPYFAEAFDLEIVGVINREPGSEPTAAELAETIDLVNEKGIKALFAEPQYPVQVAEMIADETGARVFILDPIASGEPSVGLYEQLMRQNLAVLMEALSD